MVSTIGPEMKGCRMDSEIQKVTGGCLCGAVRYEAEVFLRKAYYCHCRDCQKNSGQPAALGVPIKMGTLRFTHEEPKYYVSSQWGLRGFCPHCGSGLVWKARDPTEDWLTNLSPGSFDSPEDVRPCMHIYVERQLSWYKPDDDLPKVCGEDMDQVAAVWKDERLGTPDEN